MAHLAVSTHIAVSPDRAFALCSDFRNAASNVRAIQAVEVIGDGPIGPGTRFRETRIMFGRSCTETMEVTAWDPPRAYSLSAASCGTRYVSTFTFHPENDGTRVEMSFDAMPQTLLARLMSPMFRFMINTCRKAIQQDLADIKAVAEGFPPQAVPVSG